MYRYCSLVRQAFQWFLNVQKQFGFAAQDSFTVQNHQQDWNDEFIEGTIMRITLPENEIQLSTIRHFVVFCTKLEKGKGLAGEYWTSSLSRGYLGYASAKILHV